MNENEQEQTNKLKCYLITGYALFTVSAIIIIPTALYYTNNLASQQTLAPVPTHTYVPTSIPSPSSLELASCNFTNTTATALDVSGLIKTLNFNQCLLVNNDNFAVCIRVSDFATAPLTKLNTLLGNCSVVTKYCANSYVLGVATYIKESLQLSICMEPMQIDQLNKTWYSLSVLTSAISFKNNPTPGLSLIVTRAEYSNVSTCNSYFDDLTISTQHELDCLYTTLQGVTHEVLGHVVLSYENNTIGS